MRGKKRKTIVQIMLSSLLVFFDSALLAGARMSPRVAMDLAGWSRRRDSRVSSRGAHAGGSHGSRALR